MGLKEHADPRRLRHGLLQYLQLLGDEVGEQHVSPVMLPPGRAEARHVPEADGVGMGGEHDGDRLGRLSGGLHLGRRRREYDVDIHADQLGRQLRQLVDRFRPPELNDNVLAFDVAEFTQARPQRLDPVAEAEAGPKPRNPIRGTFAGCCARAATGHAAAAPPSSAMNSRRFTRSPRRRGRARCQAR